MVASLFASSLSPSLPPPPSPLSPTYAQMPPLLRAARPLALPPPLGIPTRVGTTTSRHRRRPPFPRPNLLPWARSPRLVPPPLSPQRPYRPRFLRPASRVRAGQPRRGPRVWELYASMGHPWLLLFHLVKRTRRRRYRRRLARLRKSLFSPPLLSHQCLLVWTFHCPRQEPRLSLCHTCHHPHCRPRHLARRFVP